MEVPVSAGRRRADVGKRAVRPPRPGPLRRCRLGAHGLDRHASARVRGRTGPSFRGEGFTLVEMLVAIGIFVAMGAALVTLWRMALNAWSVGERRRMTYERAQEALGTIALDLEAAYTREPMASGVPTARFFCTRDPATGRQKLAFVRTFETGPERALTFRAGTGSGGATYGDGYAGDGSDLGAINGLLGVSYTLSGRELRRAASGPPASGLTSPAGNRAGEVVIDGVLFLGFRFWTQYTDTWNAPPAKLVAARVWRWPEAVWDSTRGAGIMERDELGRVRPFALAKGPASRADPSDDVFPEAVEITIVIEPDERRAVRTDLIEPVTESGMTLRVASTREFPDPSLAPSHILVGGEWMRYKSKDDRRFDIADRGVRWTARSAHAKGTRVRIGTTFVMRVHVPGGRADWASTSRRR